MEIFEKLSTKELRMMDNYINAYATESPSDRADINYILRVWAEAKSKYLFKLFGEKLILSRNINVKKEPQELTRELELMYHSNDKYSNFIKEYRTNVVDAWYAYYSPSTLGQKNYDWSIYNTLDSLINPENLATNIYNGETFEFSLPHFEKPLKINKGAKITRTLGKIAELCGITESFEDFRIAHSQVLNQKSFHGNLCLSIHPFDYMTMSDNASGWSSCMSWQNAGCYCQGTVEMMNSPMVVVAYLNAEKDMSVPGGFDYTWNNKKWRELFIVTPEMIGNIKGYPYRSDFLASYVLSWLKELAETANFSNYAETITTYNAFEDFELNNCTVSIVPVTVQMYNDFSDNQLAYFSVSNPIQDTYSVNYSGESECMNCGSTSCYFSSEGNLMGECCDEYYECEECGDHFSSSDDLVEIDGVMLCHDCVDNYCESEEINGELHLARNLRRFHLATDTGYYKYDYINVFDGDAEDSRVMKRYFKRIYYHVYKHHAYYVVKYTDCTKDGLRLFGYETLEEANNSNCYEEKISLGNDEDYKIYNLSESGMRGPSIWQSTLINLDK